MLVLRCTRGFAVLGRVQSFAKTMRCNSPGVQARPVVANLPAMRARVLIVAGVLEAMLCFSWWASCAGGSHHSPPAGVAGTGGAP